MFPPWRISILGDIRPMGYKLYAVVVFGLIGKDLSFKSVLGRCVLLLFILVKFIW